MKTISLTQIFNLEIFRFPKLGNFLLSGGTTLEDEVVIGPNGEKEQSATYTKVGEVARKWYHPWEDYLQQQGEFVVCTENKCGKLSCGSYVSLLLVWISKHK